MCNRYVAPAAADIERQWHLGARNPTNLGLQPPTWRKAEVFPRAPGAFIRRPSEEVAPAGGRELVVGQWGLVPFFAKTPKLPYANAIGPYVSLKATRALLTSSLAARSARLAADDMVSTDEAAELASTSRVTVNTWIAKGRCIGLSQTKRGFRLPRWQFEPLGWPLVPRLAAALGTTEGWALLAFLETLGGVTPRAPIERGQGTRVLDIAEQEGN